MKKNPHYSLELINELTLEEAIFLSVETSWLETELKSNGRGILKGNRKCGILIARFLFCSAGLVFSFIVQSLKINKNKKPNSACRLCKSS